MGACLTALWFKSIVHNEARTSLKRINRGQNTPEHVLHKYLKYKECKVTMSRYL